MPLKHIKQYLGGKGGDQLATLASKAGMRCSLACSKKSLINDDKKLSNYEERRFLGESDKRAYKPVVPQIEMRNPTIRHT